MSVSGENILTHKFGFLGDSFLQEIEDAGVKTFIKSKCEVISENDKIKNIFFLLSGSLKVYTLNDGRELIYYYLKPSESCLMTFSAIFKNYTSRVNIVAEEDSEILVIPVGVVQSMLLRYPELSRLFFVEYDRRFSDLMNTINDAVFHKLDKRIFNYISQQIDATGLNPIKITHREIAAKLGTSREVVSRILKKMENEGDVFQSKSGIGILQGDVTEIITIK
jgi:CRP/FNR family transcriptional regulator